MEKGLDQDAECSDILYTMSALPWCDGSLMAQMTGGHSRCHMLAEDGGAADEQARAADDLISAFLAYLK